MDNKVVLTRILASVGTVLTWLPLLAPILLAVAFFAEHRLIRIDYLMPLALFPVALAGGMLLLWASVRAHAYTKSIAWGLILAAAILVGSQGLAVMTGVASGETELRGWRAFVVVSVTGYTLALAMVGIAGARLMRDVLRPAR